MGKHEPPGRIHGEVVSAATGEPIPQAFVRIFDDVVVIDLQRTNSRGRFTSRLLFADEYRLEIQHDDTTTVVDGVRVNLAETTNVTVQVKYEETG